MFDKEQASMAEDNLAILQRARANLVQQRLAVARTLAEGVKRPDAERQMMAIVDIQHVIEVIDRAIADEQGG